MVVKVVANKGVEYKEYKKDGKHRIYFKDSQGQSRPVEIGNYDLIEGRFFSDKKFNGPHWDIVESADDARALIVIGGERQVFVGPRSATSDSSSASSSRKTGNDTQSRITLGMCINNATSVVVSRMSNNPVNSFHMNNEVVVRQIFDLAEEMFAEYKNRFD
jgi:hypothetical protein